MALTPEEQDQLDYVNERLSEIDDEKQGQKAVAAKAAATPSKPPTPDGSAPYGGWALSPIRALLGGVRDAAQGVISTEADLEHGIGLPGPISLYEHLAGHSAELPDFKGSANASTPEKLVRGLVSFAVPFTTALKATSALRALPLLGRAVETLGGETATEFTTFGRLAQNASAAALTDFAQKDPVGGNMANILKDTFGLDNSMLNSLAAEPDDGALVGRLKAAAAGAPIGIASDALLEAGAKGLRAYRAWKGTMEQNQGIIDAFAKGPVTLLNKEADAEAAVATPIRRTVRGLKGKMGVVEMDPNTFTSMDDVLGFLKEKAGNIEMNPDELQRFAANLADGDPENALAKLGIDPAKLDYSAYRDADALGRLQTGLAHVYETLAGKLGRTGERVTTEQIARGAESLASSPEVLRSLYKSSSGLAEKIMAARFIAGAHAHKLLATASAAMKELEAGPPGQAWHDFMEAFTEHAYLLGQLRGAGSEVGRALRSLQMLTKVSKKKAADLLDNAFKADEAVRANPKASSLSIEDGAVQFSRLLETDADKVKALKRLMDLNGDVAELSRTVREGSGTGLTRVSDAVKETMGSLFTPLTATRNAIGSMGYLGVKVAGSYAAAAVRTPLGILSKAAALEARRARVEAWAITEGLIGGFRPAISAALGVLKREGFSEAAINLDSLGFEKLAKQAEIKSAQADRQIGEHFERAEVVRAKAFSLTGSERKRLAEQVDALDGPKFFKMGLKGLLHLTGAATNAAGSAFRAGTTAFINVPDELVGTIATHAGAYQTAVRIATKEATQAGLEGPEFTQFLRARAQVLYGDGPKGWSQDAELGGVRHIMQRAGTAEAKRVLFQDDLEWELSRKIARFHQGTGGLGTLVVPFMKTPLRILETVATDLNPLGFLVSRRLRAAVLAGGSQRDEAVTRMSLGLVSLMAGYELAKSRAVVGQDGGYQSTAREAGRPSYSFKIGDDVVAFNGFDPMATWLGMGADLHAYEQANENDPEAATGLVKMFSAFTFAISANVLSKSWLTSLKDLTDLAGATSGDDWELRKQAFLKSYSTRLVPAAGIQKGIEQAMDPYTREATSFGENIWRTSIGGSALPVKRNFLGRPVETPTGQRLFALPESEMPQDPVMREMERLSFQTPANSRRQHGVKLNASQFSRFLELRGQIVKDQTGLTMDQKLKVLIEGNAYKGLPSDAARVAAIHTAINGYTGLASDALTKEDPSFAQARLKEFVYKQATLQGWTPEQRDQTLSKQSQVLATWLQHQPT